jgi:epoxide hydrolase-like predicted phosphatase
MITTIIFDVGGVLMSWPSEAVYNDLKNELNLNDEEFRLFWKKYIGMYGKGEITESRLWQEARKELGIRKVLVKENLLSREFANATEVYANVLEKVGELKKQNFQVAILSNTNNVHSRVMRQKKVFDQFEHVYLSHIVGIRKPDPQIFHHVLTELKVKPNETIFIDDTLENIEAAKKIGIHTILATSPRQIINELERALL